MGSEILDLVPGNSNPLKKMVDEVPNLMMLCHLTLSNLDLPVDEKQAWLELTSAKERALKCLELIPGRRW